MIKKLISLRYKYLYLFLFNIFFLCANHSVIAQDNTSILNSWLQYRDARNPLYHHLTGEAYKLIDLREKEVSHIETAEEFETMGQWQKRQKEIKKTIWNTLGSFSEKTPLNARITSTIKKDGYRVENIIYESLPDFYVTSSLFIPDNLQKPSPAILFCTGHSGIAYRRPYYQLPLINLVKKGFIVLAFDPIGQGERLQYFDPNTGASIIGGSTKEHSYPSVQVSLIGQSIARYFIWDGIRGIDYLVSRKEVDPGRIGVHGLSGGGTQTSYISALDDRVVAAAPAGYITSFRRLMESIGVQDGEQNFYHGILKGIDHADFIELRAPKPTLIMATTRDFFSIQGARETYKEAKHVYGIFGKPENLEKVEDDLGHGYTKKTREAMYAFFQKNLRNPGSSKEEEVEYLSEKELQKTSTGQLSTSLKGETVFSLNRKEAGKDLRELIDSRGNLKQHLQMVPAKAKLLSGYREPSLSDKPVFSGRFQENGYFMEKYFVKGEGEYVLPYLLLIPEKPNKKLVIYLHPKGKGIVTGNKEIHSLVEKGFTVLVPDLLGTGELGEGDFSGDASINGVSYNLLYTAMQIGRSIVGIQASDIIKLSRILVQKYGVTNIWGIAREEMSPALLYAAAFDSVISRVALVKPYSSYRSVVEERFYDSRFVFSLVPGALTAYDLPDIAASLAPKKLLVAGITDANGQPIKKEEQKSDWEIVRNAYRSKKSEGTFKILSDSAIKDADALFKEWLK